MKVSVSICKWIKCSTLQSHVPGLTSDEWGPLHFHCHHLDVLIYKGNYLGLWLAALEFHLCLHSLLTNFWGYVLWSHEAELPHYEVCKLKYKSRSTSLGRSDMAHSKRSASICPGFLWAAAFILFTSKPFTEFLLEAACGAKHQAREKHQVRKPLIGQQS